MQPVVALFTERFYPEPAAIAVRSYALIQGLLKTNKFKCKVYTCTKIADLDSNKKYETKNLFMRASSNEMGIVRRLLGEIFIGLEAFSRLLFSRYDVLIITSPPFVAGVLVALCAKIRKKPFLFDVRDYYPEILFDMGVIRRSSFLASILLKIEAKLYRSAYKIGTVTEQLQVSIQKKVIDPKKVILYRNGFIETDFKPSHKKFPKFTVVFHSNFGKLPDIDLLLEVAAIVEKKDSSIEFLLIGEGTNVYKITESKLKNLRYIGKVDHEKISDIIGKCHVGLAFGSKGKVASMGIPVKVFEYIGVGIPVIRTPLGECGEMLEKNKIGFEFTGDAAKPIAEKIISLKKSKSSMEKLSATLKKKRLQFTRIENMKLFIREIEKYFEK